MEVKVTQSCLTLCDPMDYIVHWILQARILEWVAIPFFKGSSQLRDQTQVSHITGRFFIIWATRKAQNTGVGSLSLLQKIVPIQELNWGLLHCKWILYQLNYQGSPGVPEMPIVNFSGKKKVIVKIIISCIPVSCKFKDTSVISFIFYVDHF